MLPNFRLVNAIEECRKGRSPTLENLSHLDVRLNPRNAWIARGLSAEKLVGPHK